MKKAVLKNFAKLTGKYLCQSLFPATLLKKNLKMLSKFGGSGRKRLSLRTNELLQKHFYLFSFTLFMCYLSWLYFHFKTKFRKQGLI